MDDRDTRKAKPLAIDDVRTLIASYDNSSLRGNRNRVLFTILGGRGFRSATAVAIQIENVRFEEFGVIIGLRDEKTSITRELVFTGTPHSKRHRFCIPCELKKWIVTLEALDVTVGPLFRPIDRWGRLAGNGLTTESITMLLREGLKRAGVPDSHLYSSHSFRHGVVKAALRYGWSNQAIMQLTLHRSERGLQPYIEDYDVWRNAPQRSLLAEVSNPSTPERGWHHAF